MKKIAILFILLNLIYCSNKEEFKYSADAYNLLSVIINNNTTNIYNGKTNTQNENENGSSTNYGCGLECLKATGIYLWSDNTNDGYDCEDYFEKGNANYNIEPGENGRLRFSLSYNGTTPINNIKVNIAPLNPDIKVYDRNLSYPEINGEHTQQIYSCPRTSSYSTWGNSKTCAKTKCDGWRTTIPSALNGKIIFRLFISSSLGNTFFDVTL